MPNDIQVFIRTPYSVNRNLGQAYNQEMALIPDGHTACFIDGDVCFLTPNYGHVLSMYANAYPDAVLTCWVNRIHELAKDQRLQCSDEHRNDIAWVTRQAGLMAENATPEEISNPLTGPISGTCLLIPKKIWEQHKFTEVNTYRPNEPNLLGVDNHFTNTIRAAGIEILRMNCVLGWHNYRLLDGSKKHLL